MFTLITLPYSKDALAPVISAQTLEFHHGKHLQGYVDNLNKLIAGTAFENLPLEEIVKQATGGMFNNAGQILNHNLYFTQFAPKPAAPAGKVVNQIVKQWGSLDAFKEEFVAKGVGLFGSGWVWLSAQADGTTFGSTPIISIIRTVVPPILLLCGKSSTGMKLKNVTPNNLRNYGTQRK